MSKKCYLEKLCSFELHVRLSRGFVLPQQLVNQIQGRKNRIKSDRHIQTTFPHRRFNINVVYLNFYSI